MRGNGRLRLRGKIWHIVYYGPTSKGWKEIYETSRSSDSEVAARLLAERVQAVRNHRAGLTPFVGPSHRRLTLGKVLDRLLDEMRLLESRSLRTASSQLRRFRERFGSWSAVEITSSVLFDYQRMRVGEGAAKATIDREVELVLRAFHFADLPFAPTAKKLLKANANARQGFLRPNEFESVIEEIEDQDFRDWLVWFWWTGMRNGETSSLTWSGFEDGDPPMITLFGENAKIRKPRKLPIVGPLRDVMERRIKRRRQDCPLVFHRSGRSFRASQGGLPNWCYAIWKKACEAVGLPDLRPYDLRRSAVRNLIHAGVPELTAMKVTGHESRETFRRYAIQDPSEIAAAIEAVETYVSRQKAPSGQLLAFSKESRRAGKTRANDR